jgi:myo-inositol 2-dehydrogenase/D-chiro-inositol 1-dehydrogenase
MNAEALSSPHTARGGAVPSDAQVIRVGLIGTGAMGADHAERIAQRCAGARLVAVCDADAELGRATATRVGGCRVEDDPMALIGADDVDGVLIATPGPTHEALLLACLERDLPVLCEKPLTPDAASSLRVVEAEVALGHRRVQVGFMRRFDAQYEELKRTLDGGSLGAPVMLHCAHRAPSVPPWFSESMLISDAVVHEFDVTRWLLGQEIAAVSVLRRDSARPEPDGAPTPQIVVFEMSGPVLVDVEIFVSAGYGYQVRCEAVCEAGTMLIGDNTGPVVQHEGRWGGEVTQDFRVRFAHAYDREVQAWVESVRTRMCVGPSAWDGYAAAAAADAGMEAQRTGNRVEVQLTERPPLYR